MILTLNYFFLFPDVHFFGTTNWVDHYTVDYPIAMPVAFNNPSILDPSAPYYIRFAYRDQFHFCKGDSTEDCQAWNIRTGNWTVDSGRPKDVLEKYYCVVEVNEKLWVTGGITSTGFIRKKTEFLDQEGNWSPGPNLPNADA